MKGTNKLKEHMEILCFDSHEGLCQSKENKCMQCHLYCLLRYIYSLVIDKDLCEY